MPNSDIFTVFNCCTHTWYFGCIVHTDHRSYVGYGHTFYEAKKSSESHQIVLLLSRRGAVTLTSLNTVQSYEGWNFSCSSGGRFSIFSRSCLCLRSAPFSCKNKTVLSLQSPFYSLCFNLSQHFSTFVRPRPGRFFFHQTRARSQQIYL